jgi:hypothetical protein
MHMTWNEAVVSLALRRLKRLLGDTGNLLVALVPIETVSVEDDMTGLSNARSVR